MMSKIFFWVRFAIALVLLGVWFIFFRLNMEVVTVDYLIDKIEMKMSIVLLVVFVLGALMTFLLVALSDIRMMWTIARQKSEIKYLKERLNERRQDS